MVSGALDVLDGWFDGLARRLDVPRFAGMTARYAFLVDGADDVAWCVSVRDGQVSVAKDTASGADLSIRAGEDVWRQVLAGRLEPARAILSGRLSLAGDVSLALKLGHILNAKGD